jgi:SAM-dependent methyltransferase
VGSSGVVSTTTRRVIRALLPEQWRARINYRLHGEPALIKAELSALSVPWRDFASRRSSRRMTERVVEIPWALSRYQGEQRVLDIGTANAVGLYLDYLRGLPIRELRGIDLSPREVRGVDMVVADVRAMPFRPHAFDLILCVSSLEHIGMDNAMYGIAGRQQAGGDRLALEEMRRVIAPTGRLLVTVPFGRPVDYGWFRQYDLAGWTRLLAETGWLAVEQAFYGYMENGWAPVDGPGQVASAEYRQLDAPAATGLLCAELRSAARQ